VVIASAALVSLAFGALQTATKEEFARPPVPVWRPVPPSRAAHPVSLAEFNAARMPTRFSSMVASHDRRRT
jgi:hypothetical protein